MTDTTTGFLWTINNAGNAVAEILNDHRTRHYQALHPLWNGLTCVECECAVLGYNPLSGAAITYGATPSDATYPAPWYNALIPASAEFLGWMVDSVDGFGYSHYARTINQRAGTGANVTPMRAGGREVTYTVIGTALSERGMVYGLNWLASTLLCLGGRCGSGRVMVRPWCDDSGLPSVTSGGLYELREAALTVAPSWTDKFLEEHGCLVREARFTFIAGDPCFYSGATAVCSASGLTLTRTPYNTVCGGGATMRELICGPLPVTISTAYPVCCSVSGTGSGIISAHAASVVITATSGTSGPFAIESYTAPVGTACASVVGNVTDFLGRVTIGRLSSGQSAMIDGASGQVYFQAGPSDPWEPDDSLLVIPPDEFPFFPILASGNDLVVAVRPGLACVSLGTFSVSVSSVTVTSCNTCG